MTSIAIITHRQAARLSALALALLITLVSGLIPGQSQIRAQGVSSSYLTPFPAGGTYKVLVIGDGFAEGLWGGLLKATAGNKKIKLYKEVSYSAGLIKRNRRDWVKNLDQILSVNKYDIAVIMVGYGDRRKIKIKRKTIAMNTPQWGVQYRKRLRQALRKFAARKIAVYWVGMPITRQNRVRKEFDIINEMAKIQTSSAEVRFIDHWLHFANESGLYSPYGPDVNGKIRLLRSREGLFFTRAGYEKLGHFVYKFIQRDLRDAKSDRNVLLLGEAADQKYLLTRYAIENPRNRNEGDKRSGQTAGLSLSQRFSNLSSARNLYETPRHSTILVKDKNDPEGKKIRLKIVRPAIPAIAFTITKKTAVASAGEKDPEERALMVEKEAKMMGLSLASSLPQFSAGTTGRRMPLTQTPYYKLVVRGDPQQSRQGRADYFVWTKKSEKTTDNDKQQKNASE